LGRNRTAQENIQEEQFGSSRKKSRKEEETKEEGKRGEMIGSVADYNSQGRSAEDRQRSVKTTPLFF
jgi:hypothetical protein